MILGFFWILFFFFFTGRQEPQIAFDWLVHEIKDSLRVFCSLMNSAEDGFAIRQLITAELAKGKKNDPITCTSPTGYDLSLIHI